MPGVPNESDEPHGGGLRNTIYQQQTRSGRRLTRGRLLLYRAALPVVLLGGATRSGTIGRYGKYR